MKSSQDAYVTSERVGPLHRKHGVWGGEFKDHKGSYEAVTAYIHTYSIYSFVHIQSTLEQHGFETHRSTYTQTFLDNYSTGLYTYFRL